MYQFRCEGEICILVKTEEKVSKQAQAHKSSFKLVGLDGVRGFACLMVIVHHCSQFVKTKDMAWWGKDIISYFLVWNISLCIFFVLSGFLLAYPFWSNFLNQKEFPSLKKYFVRRAARIMPGFYVALTVSLVVNIVLDFKSTHMILRYLVGLTFMSGYHYVTLFPVDTNTPLWSSSVEVFCYIMLPLFMAGLFWLLGKKRSFKSAIIYWVLVVFLMIFINQLIHIFLTPDSQGRGWKYGNIGGAKLWMPDYNPVAFFCHFAMGILGAGITTAIYKKTQGLKGINTKYFDMVSLGAFAASFILIWFLKEMPENSFSIQNQPFFFPTYAIILAIGIAFLPISKNLGRVLDNRFLRFSAKVSFGLYLYHYLIMIVIQKVWIKNFQYMGMDSWQKWAGLTLLVVAVSFILATLSYYFVEKPFIDRVYKTKA